MNFLNFYLAKHWWYVPYLSVQGSYGQLHLSQELKMNFVHVVALPEEVQ